VGRKSNEERESLIAKYRASGLTPREFAETHGVREDTLSRWLNPKRREPSQSPGTFIELPPSRGSVVELRFPDGVVLSIRS
jgi:transposase-like protein